MRFWCALEVSLACNCPRLETRKTKNSRVARNNTVAASFRDDVFNNTRVFWCEEEKCDPESRAFLTRQRDLFFTQRPNANATTTKLDGIIGMCV